MQELNEYFRKTPDWAYRYGKCSLNQSDVNKQALGGIFSRKKPRKKSAPIIAFRWGTHLYMSIFHCLCLSVCLSVCLPVCPSIRPSVHTSCDHNFW